MDDPSEIKTPLLPSGEENQTVAPEKSEDSEKNNRKTIIIIVIVAVVLLTAIAFGVATLSRMDAAGTGKIRDIFIIFLAVEFLVIGIALIVLIVQLANLINLLNNEVRPIINTANETMNNLKGTTQFLSDNMVEPVIKLNEYVAGLKKLLDVFKIVK